MNKKNKQGVKKEGTYPGFESLFRTTVTVFLWVWGLAGVIADAQQATDTQQREDSKSVHSSLRKHREKRAQRCDSEHCSAGSLMATPSAFSVCLTSLLSLRKTCTLDYISIQCC